MPKQFEVLPYLDIFESESVPPDRIYFVPKRELHETYDHWLRRCAVLNGLDAPVTHDAGQEERPPAESAR